MHNSVLLHFNSYTAKFNNRWELNMHATYFKKKQKKQNSNKESDDHLWANMAMVERKRTSIYQEDTIQRGAAATGMGVKGSRDI